MIKYKSYNHFIPRFGMIEPDQLLGEDTLLNNPYYEQIFNAILDDYKPTHKNVLLSICCRIRPYYTSVRWQTFIKTFEENSDFVVLSNSGVIPMEYATCYPFMEYKAAHLDKNDPLFQATAIDRLTRLFEKNLDGWDNAVFVINKGDFKRWTPIVESLHKRFGDKLKLLPTDETYEASVNEWKTEKQFKGNFNRYPLIHPYILREIGQYIPMNKPSKQSLF